MFISYLGWFGCFSSWFFAQSTRGVQCLWVSARVSIMRASFICPIGMVRANMVAREIFPLCTRLDVTLTPVNQNKMPNGVHQYCSVNRNQVNFIHFVASPKVYQNIDKIFKKPNLTCQFSFNSLWSNLANQSNLF